MPARARPESRPPALRASLPSGKGPRPWPSANAGRSGAVRATRHGKRSCLPGVSVRDATSVMAPTTEPGLVAFAPVPLAGRASKTAAPRSPSTSIADTEGRRTVR